MNKISKVLFLVGLLFSISFLCFSQDEEDFEMAEIYELRNEFGKAIEIYEKALLKAERSKQYDYWIILARLYSHNNQPKDALKYFTKIQGLRRSKENIFNFAKCLKYNGNYDQAKKQFERVKRNFPDDTLAETYMASCDSALNWFKNPNPDYEVYEATRFNSKGRDFSPIALGNQIIFSTSRTDFSSKGADNLHLHKYDLFSTKIDINRDYEHTPTPKLFEGISTKEHEAGASFSKDGNKVFFTRTIKGKMVNGIQQNVLNIFYSEKTEDGWSEHSNSFKFNSDEHSSGHPTLSSDGKSIIYMSDIPDGSGKADLYISTKENGKWTDGTNLGSVINTSGNELFPFLTGDTLYFASDGHLGMGKLDIFMSVYSKSTGQWSRPINLKFPVNTTFDDFGLCTFGNPNNGFFCSNRPKGTGNDDIYIFTKSQLDKIIVSDKLVSFEKNRFFGNIDAKVFNQNNSNIDLSQNNTLISTQVNLNELYKVQYLKEELIENNADFRLSSDPNRVISQIEVKTYDKPVLLNAQAKSGEIIYNQRDVYVLQNNIPVDTIKTDDNGFYSFEIPSGNDFTFVMFSELGIKDFEAIRYFNINAKILAKRGGIIKDANIKVELDSSFYKNISSDSLGQFSFVAKQNQRVNLTIFKEGFFEKDTTFTVPNSNEKDITTKIILDEKPKMEMVGTLVYQGKPVINAFVDVIQGTKVVAKVKTNEAGEYKIPVFDNEEYNVVINKDGLFTLDTIIKMRRTGSLEDTVVRMNQMAMKEIKLNEDVTLNSIYFEYKSFVINKESQLSLDKLYEFLLLNPRAIVEINSHTDARGEENYNLLLSNKRVESVKKYLVGKGMTRSKVVTKGYGESKLVIQNATTEAEHKKNRRTQFRVIDYLDYSTMEDPKLLPKNTRSYLVHVESFDSYKTKDEINLSDKTELKTVMDKDNTIKFFFGPYNSEIKAQKFLEACEAQGYNDAYIQVFENGKERAYETE